MGIRVLLADDHEVFRRETANLLRRQGYTLVGEARDGREAVEVAERNRPDVAVLDLNMPELRGVDAGREIRLRCPDTKVVLLTGHNEIPYVIEALKAGITGYILKARAADELGEAIREVAEGELHLCPVLCRRLVLSLLEKLMERAGTR